MSMKNYSNYGNVVKAEAFVPLLPHLSRSTFLQAIEDSNEEEALSILSLDLPERFPCPVEMITLNDECETNGDMELNTMYGFFDEDDLYCKTRTPALSALVKAGVEPGTEQWVSFG